MTGSNIFPSKEEEKTLYNMSEGEKLVAEFNSQAINMSAPLSQEILVSISNLVNSKQSVKLVTAKDSGTEEEIPGRIAVIAQKL